METTFKPSDDILKQLVSARRDEVVGLQKSQADHIEDLETRGQARTAALDQTLPKDIVAVLRGLDKTHDQASATTKAHTDRVRTKLATTGPSLENETAVHPGLAGDHLVAPNSLG